MYGIVYCLRNEAAGGQSVPGTVQRALDAARGIASMSCHLLMPLAVLVLHACLSCCRQHAKGFRRDQPQRVNAAPNHS
jgi:hypothetical protein